MLVLSRKKNEEIVLAVPPTAVPLEITVLTVECRGDKVRLGIEAPKCVLVHRREIQDKIDRENREAAKCSPSSGS